MFSHHEIVDLINDFYSSVRPKASTYYFVGGVHLPTQILAPPTLFQITPNIFIHCDSFSKYLRPNKPFKIIIENFQVFNISIIMETYAKYSKGLSLGLTIRRIFFELGLL